MDSLTQAVLGAAVGEAVPGKKVGNKAAAWGAVAGTLPDLDVLLNPFLNDVRFGRSDGWLRDEGAYVFSFHIQRDPADTSRVTSIEQKPFTSGLDATLWRPLLRRIGGR